MEAKITPGAPQDVEKWSKNFSGGPPAGTSEFFFAPGGPRDPPKPAQSSYVFLDPGPQRAPRAPRSAPGGPRGPFWEDFGASWANFGRIFGAIFDSLFDASRQHFRDLLPPPEAFRQLFSERFFSPLRRPQTSKTQETATPHKIQRTGEVFPGRGRGGVVTPILERFSGPFWT